MEPGALQPIVPEVALDLRSVVRLGLAQVEPVRIASTARALEAEIEETRSALGAEHAGRAPSDIPGLAPARTLYRAFGIDPTRIRPSSEALLRRVVAGKPLPSISNAVDLCNLSALRFLLPIGLYDTGALHGQVSARRGKPGESYAGIRKEEVHVAGRPVLADEKGAFGNPTSDSLRTAVTPATRGLWMVIFAPASFPRDALEAHAASARDAMIRHLVAEGETPRSAASVTP